MEDPMLCHDRWRKPKKLKRREWELGRQIAGRTTKMTAAAATTTATATATTTQHQQLTWWCCLVGLISWMLWILLHSWQQWPLSNKSTGPREMSRFHVPKWWIMMSPAWSQPQFLAIYSELSWAHPKWWHKGIPLNRTLILVQKPR